jgi:hypothetical protein
MAIRPRAAVLTSVTIIGSHDGSAAAGEPALCHLNLPLAPPGVPLLCQACQALKSRQLQDTLHLAELDDSRMLRPCRLAGSALDVGGAQCVTQISSCFGPCRAVLHCAGTLAALWQAAASCPNASSSGAATLSQLAPGQLWTRRDVSWACAMVQEWWGISRSLHAFAAVLTRLQPE